MKIVGLDELVFGVPDLTVAEKYLTDYGLRRCCSSESGARFEALDSTAIVVRKAADSSLPRALSSSIYLREAVYGVADRHTLERIAAELSRDRDVSQSSDGVVHSVDEDGYPIAFQETVRVAIPPPPDLANVPGRPPGRALNQVASIDGMQARPSTLSHFVLFSRDRAKAETFYAQRLGFRAVDYFDEIGVFMRPAGSYDHHTLFIVQHPAGTPGVHHFTFHLSGAHELLKAGYEFSKKGYASYWGPGRHVLGSNYFWYFKSPFGALMEYDADMDQHDDRWIPRHVPANVDTMQMYLFQSTPKWWHVGA